MTIKLYGSPTSGAAGSMYTNVRTWERVSSFEEVSHVPYVVEILSERGDRVRVAPGALALVVEA